MTAKAKAPAKATNGNGSPDLRERIRESGAKGFLHEVGEWGVEIELRSMSIRQKDKLSDQSDDLGAFAPGVLIATCFDPTSGEPMFTADDTDLLADAPASIIEPLLLAALKKSGMSDDDLAASIESGKEGS